MVPLASYENARKKSMPAHQINKKSNQNVLKQQDAASAGTPKGRALRARPFGFVVFVFLIVLLVLWCAGMLFLLLLFS